LEGAYPVWSRSLGRPEQAGVLTRWNATHAQSADQVATAADRHAELGSSRWGAERHLNTHRDRATSNIEARGVFHTEIVSSPLT
jgi:hypothetical protein